MTNVFFEGLPAARKNICRRKERNVCHFLEESVHTYTDNICLALSDSYATT